MSDKKNVVKKKVQFRPLNDQGFQKMEYLLELFEWDGILKITNKQVVLLQSQALRNLN